MMEKGQCLMSMKRQILRSGHYQAPVFYALAGSREERALPEDFSGSVWPPRCYTCSFCSREFRSAQALGGHMNVHRRDRARLKQQSLNASQNPNDHQNPSTVSSENIKQQGVLDQHLNTCFVLPPARGTSALSRTTRDDDAKGICSIALPNKKLQMNPESEKKQGDGGLEGSKRAARDSENTRVRTDLSVGLSSCGNEATVISCKRAKITSLSRLPFWVSNEKRSFKLEVVGVLENSSRNVHEDLDLELRLGADPPKVK